MLYTKKKLVCLSRAKPFSPNIAGKDRNSPWEQSTLTSDAKCQQSKLFSSSPMLCINKLDCFSQVWLFGLIFEDKGRLLALPTSTLTYFATALKSLCNRFQKSLLRINFGTCTLISWLVSFRWTFSSAAIKLSGRHMLLILLQNFPNKILLQIPEFRLNLMKIGKISNCFSTSH